MELQHLINGLVASGRRLLTALVCCGNDRLGWRAETKRVGSEDFDVIGGVGLEIGQSELAGTWIGSSDFELKDANVE